MTITMSRRLLSVQQCSNIHPMNEEMNDAGTNEDAELAACPNCNQSNDPLMHFCTKCGAPLSALANVGPWERTLSEGFALRQAVSGPPKRIILVGMWLLFCPALITSCLILFTMIPHYSGFDRKDIGVLLPVLLTAIVSAVLLFRTTKNYICKKSVEQMNRADMTVGPNDKTDFRLPN